MAKRTNNGGTAAPGRNQSKNGSDPTARNGENRPALAVKTNDKGQIFSHIRQKWLVETPEERVRQAYLETLRNEYGFDLNQWTALWRGEIPDCLHQNHILKVRVNRLKAMPEFLLEYMSSIPSRNHFRARAKITTNLASINSNDLRELSLPLPPHSVQQAMVKQVETGRAEIAKLKADAKARANAAKADVEAMILGTKPVA